MTLEWFDWVDDVLTQIEQLFPHASDDVRREMIDRLHHLLDLNDAWLDEWLVLQERFHQLLQKYPELAEKHQGSETRADSLSESDSSEAGDSFFDFVVGEESLHQFRVGQGYYELLMFPEAVEQFGRVIDREPDFLLGRLYLAMTFFQQGRWDEAEKHFSLVLKGSPQKEFSRFAHHMLGCIAIRRRQDRDAARHFAKALEYDSRDSDTLFNLGACYFRLGLVRLAVPCFKSVLEINEDDWGSMVYLARACTVLGQTAEGEKWRKKAYATSQKPWIISEIAAEFERRGQFEQSLKWHWYGVSKHPEWAEGYHGVAWSMWHLKRRQEAVAWLKKALTLERDEPNLLFSFWWMSHLTGSAEEQKRVVRYLTANVNNFSLWQLVRGNVYRLQGDLERARKALIPLLNVKEMTVQGLAHYQLGHLYMARQEWSQAAKHFYEARERNTQLRETWLFEGICHYLLGNAQQSQRCLELYRHVREET